MIKIINLLKNLLISVNMLKKNKIIDRSISDSQNPKKVAKLKNFPNLSQF